MNTNTVTITRELFDNREQHAYLVFRDGMHHLEARCVVLVEKTQDTPSERFSLTVYTAFKNDTVECCQQIDNLNYREAVTQAAEQMYDERPWC